MKRVRVWAILGFSVVAMVVLGGCGSESKSAGSPTATQGTKSGGSPPSTSSASAANTSAPSATTVRATATATATARAATAVAAEAQTRASAPTTTSAPSGFSLPACYVAGQDKCNCPNFSTQSYAQWFHNTYDLADVNRLDGSPKNGVVCEGRP